MQADRQFRKRGGCSLAYSGGVRSAEEAGGAVGMTGGRSSLAPGCWEKTPADATMEGVDMTGAGLGTLEDWFWKFGQWP